MKRSVNRFWLSLAILMAILASLTPVLLLIAWIPSSADAVENFFNVLPALAFFPCVATLAGLSALVTIKLHRSARTVDISSGLLRFSTVGTFIAAGTAAGLLLSIGVLILVAAYAMGAAFS